jgi:hypothetical protein
MENNKTSTPPYIVGLLIVVVIQIVGFALLWNEITSQQQYVYLPTLNNQETKAGTPTNQLLAVTKFPTEAVLHDAIQSALKQELGPYLRQLATAPEAVQKSIPADPPGVKENSPENIRAFTDISNILDSAIARGTWTKADAIASLQHGANLTETQRIQMLSKITQAINNQELKIEELPPIF